MKKLKLELKDVRVESFITDDLTVSNKGTVQGQDTVTQANHTLCNLSSQPGCCDVDTVIVCTD